MYFRAIAVLLAACIYMLAVSCAASSEVNGSADPGLIEVGVVEDLGIQETQESGIMWTANSIVDLMTQVGDKLAELVWTGRRAERASGKMLLQLQDQVHKAHDLRYVRPAIISDDYHKSIMKVEKIEQSGKNKQDHTLSITVEEETRNNDRVSTIWNLGKYDPWGWKDREESKVKEATSKEDDHNAETKRMKHPQLFSPMNLGSYVSWTWGTRDEIEELTKILRKNDAVVFEINIDTFAQLMIDLRILHLAVSALCWAFAKCFVKLFFTLF